MQQRTRGTAARFLGRAAKRSTIGVVLLVVWFLTGGTASVVADSLTFIGRTSDRYRYRAESSDNGWQVGDTIVLSGLEQVAGAEAPKGFKVDALTPYSVTWTCIEERPGRPHFEVYSVAAEGDVLYTITSSPPTTGTVTGPAYVPEPMTVLLFCSGLFTLAAAVRRRRSLAACRT